jgi:hypothetical protein
MRKDYIPAALFEAREGRGRGEKKIKNSFLIVEKTKILLF